VVPAIQEFSGSTYAVGTTAALGYKRMFASYDITYSSTSVDVLDGRVGSLAQSVRAGVRLGTGRLRTAVYAGAFNEDIRTAVTGVGLIPSVNPTFSIGLSPKGQWNALVGTNLEITPHVVVTVEGGFGDRTQFLVSPGVRF